MKKILGILLGSLLICGCSSTAVNTDNGKIKDGFFKDFDLIYEIPEDWEKNRIEKDDSVYYNLKDSVISITYFDNIDNTKNTSEEAAEYFISLEGSDVTVDDVNYLVNPRGFEYSFTKDGLQTHCYYLHNGTGYVKYSYVHLETEDTYETEFEDLVDSVQTDTRVSVEEAITQYSNSAYSEKRLKEVLINQGYTENQVSEILDNIDFTKAAEQAVRSLADGCDYDTGCIYDDMVNEFGYDSELATSVLVDMKDELDIIKQNVENAEFVPDSK